MSNSEEREGGIKHWSPAHRYCLRVRHSDAGQSPRGEERERGVRGSTKAESESDRTQPEKERSDEASDRDQQ